MATVYLGLGSNLGERAKNLQKAVAALSAAGILVRRLSSVIETAPKDCPPGSDHFLNAVVQAQTAYSPEDLLSVIQSIEESLGRRRSVPNAPRTIDIDILLYDDVKLVSSRLVLPHPRMFERDFVMKPLKEIAPDLCASFVM